MTIVINIFSSLDVYVRDDETDAPIAFAEVCLYEDSEQTILIGCTETDADGMARFFFVGDLFEDSTFTSNADRRYRLRAGGDDVRVQPADRPLDGNGLVDDAAHGGCHPVAGSGHRSRIAQAIRVQFRLNLALEGSPGNRGSFFVS